MKERKVQIPISNTELNIHGVLRGEYSLQLAVLVPGLGGWMHDLLLFNASRYLEKHGISSLRVSFYGDGDDQRNIGDFDVNVNTKDIDTIVNYAKRKGAGLVCVIGHSYGGMAIVYSKRQQFDTAVLWDPSHTGGYDEPMAINNLAEDFIFIKELDSYVSSKGPGYVLSRKVFENYAPGSTAMAGKFKIDTLVVNASNSKEMQKFGKDYADSINAKTKHIIIPNSSHPFTEDGAMEKLFEETVKWVKAQSLSKAGK